MCRPIGLLVTLVLGILLTPLAIDAQQPKEVVQAYQAACANVIARYDGHIAQSLADGLLVS